MNSPTAQPAPKKFLSENLSFLFIAIAIVAFSSTPFWVGRLTETNTLVFRGTYFDTSDYSVHISMMQAGRMGDWVYQMRFTSEDHSPVFIRLFYILLGHISEWVNLPVEIVFHATRWIFGLTALFSIDRLYLKIFSNNRLARIAFFLSVFGAGLGWLQIILGAPLQPISPIDFWLIDAYILFSISLFPSFSATLTLMATALRFFLDFLETGKLRLILTVCLLSVISQLFNPIAFATIDLTMASTLLLAWWKLGRIERKQGYALVFIALAQIPLFVYNFQVLERDPFWSQFTLQNQTLSPPPGFYWWGFAPFWVFALIGIIRSIREKHVAFGALSIWIVGAFILAYLPVSIQRRFLLGITIPLGAHAIYGLDFIVTHFSGKFEKVKKRENLAYFTYIMLASISAVALILGNALYMLNYPSTLFYPRDLEDAVQWLDANATPNDFVLGNITTSQIIAQRTRLKVYVGHEMETLFFESKKDLMTAYYESNVGDDWLLQTPIRWVVYGPYEQSLAPSFSPPPSLRLAYENEAVKIYQVIR